MRPIGGSLGLGHPPFCVKSAGVAEGRGPLRPAIPAPSTQLHWPTKNRSCIIRWCFFLSRHTFTYATEEKLPLGTDSGEISCFRLVGSSWDAKLCVHFCKQPNLIPDLGNAPGGCGFTVKDSVGPGRQEGQGWTLESKVPFPSFFALTMTRSTSLEETIGVRIQTGFIRVELQCKSSEWSDCRAKTPASGLGSETESCRALENFREAYHAQRNWGGNCMQMLVVLTRRFLGDLVTSKDPVGYIS